MALSESRQGTQAGYGQSLVRTTAAACFLKFGDGRGGSIQSGSLSWKVLAEVVALPLEGNNRKQPKGLLILPKHLEAEVGLKGESMLDWALVEVTANEESLNSVCIHSAASGGRVQLANSTTDNQ